MADPAANQSPQNGSGEPLATHVVLIFGLMLVGVYLAAGPRVRLSEWRVESDANPNVIEAVAWRHGRLDLPVRSAHPERAGQRPLDSAVRENKVWNVFPPLFTFLTYGALTLQDWQGVGSDGDSVFHPAWYVAIVALPLPLAAFWAFSRAASSARPRSKSASAYVTAAVLTAYLILGTPLLLILEGCRGGSVAVNQVFATVGLLLVAGDLLGSRRIWPAAIGCTIGLWSRQLTVIYLVAVAWTAWSAASGARSRRTGMAVAALAAFVGFGTVATLNWLKFGSPFENGYGLIYDGRDDIYARRYAEFGRAFDPRFIPRNAWHLWAAPPIVESRGALAVRITGDPDGAAFWFASPLLLYVLFDVRRWWGDAARRSLMLCSFAVMLALLCYHNTGSVQRGFHRFAMDFVPIWLAVIAPELFNGRRTWITLGLLAYSALYFHLIA